MIEKRNKTIAQILAENQGTSAVFDEEVFVSGKKAKVAGLRVP